VRSVIASMSNTEAQPNEDEEEKSNNEVLPQIGEDPGLPADAIEQDSKARTDKEQKNKTKAQIQQKKKKKNNNNNTAAPKI
jgi:hypothetical protein